MPLLQSTYKRPHFPYLNGHFQTILPNYLRKESLPANTQREIFNTPDCDEILVDWWRVHSTRLVIVSHGLCGHSRRHYVLSLAKAFNAVGWDCMAWNFRGTGASPGKLFKFTTQNSTEELDWITRYAIQTGGYEHIAYSGYSMGGNLTALYLSREADSLPPQVAGAALFCATTDLIESGKTFHSFMGRKYAAHFIADMLPMMRRKAAEFPGRIDITGLEGITSFDEFDDRFTAPYLGLPDHESYYRTASSCRYFSKLRVPVLLVAPQNDPFLAGDCYPVEQARRNPMLYLEMPRNGGHCGFPTSHHQTWWPARRAIEFFREHAKGFESEYP